MGPMLCCELFCHKKIEKWQKISDQYVQCNIILYLIPSWNKFWMSMLSICRIEITSYYLQKLKSHATYRKRIGIYGNFFPKKIDYSFR